ncbi:hypothetical protein [Inconstantimicrobium mannanitabidum]|uniref:Uncharacterized protein n=1 Tax=Inconstantimicrobium mannanitabidum TaxID=1604901 RepID=A0ACB5REP0_9CLOT|nr:hypothetical protein [Clostridium sp. TW13]GKX67600.1 hypothetical protein rsdtw13_28580 [Clostridium sp. TW13]
MDSLYSIAPGYVLIFIKFFWFLGALINILNLVLIMKKYKNKNAEENIKQAITIKVYKLQVVVFLILGVLQFLGGFRYALYIFDVKNVYNVWFILSWVVLIGNIILSAFYFVKNIRKY